MHEQSPIRTQAASYKQESVNSISRDGQDTPIYVILIRYTNQKFSEQVASEICNFDTHNLQPISYLAIYQDQERSLKRLYTSEPVVSIKNSKLSLIFFF